MNDVLIGPGVDAEVAYRRERCAEAGGKSGLFAIGNLQTDRATSIARLRERVEAQRRQFLRYQDHTAEVGLVMAEAELERAEEGGCDS